MPRDKGRHKRRIAPAGNGDRGRTVPIYLAEAEWLRIAAAAAERGVSTAAFLKRAGLALARADLLYGPER